MQIGTAVIPKGFTDKDGELKPGANDRIIRKGRPIDLVSQFGGDAAYFDPRVRVSPEQAAMALQMAQEQFDKLSDDDKKLTSVGAIAISINTRLAGKSTQAVSTAEKLAGELVPLPTAENAKKEKPVKKKSKITVKQSDTAISVSKHIDAAMASLRIPGLGVVPNDPTVNVEVRYLENGRPVSHVFNVHWADLLRNAYGRLSQVTLVIDTRWGDVDFASAAISYADEPMQVLIRDEEDDVDAFTCEAMRGKTVTSFGVFQLIVLNVVSSNI